MHRTIRLLSVASLLAGALALGVGSANASTDCTTPFSDSEATYVCTSATEVEVVGPAPTYPPVTEVDIPSTVTLDSVTYSVTSIGAQAFQYNNYLQKVTIPGSVKTIGEEAFYNDTTLASVVLNDGLLSIDDRAFAASPLGSITIPNTVTTIGQQAFADSSLTSLTLGSAVQDIKDSAFSPNLLTSVTIPNSVVTLGEEAFARNQLTTVSLGTSLQTIGIGAFKSEYPYSSNNAITQVTIPNSVSSIGAVAFEHNAITTVNLGSGVTSIGAEAFASNPVATLTWGSSVQTVGAGAFRDNKLTEVTIPASVTSIGGAAFHSNTLLKAMFQGDAPSIIKADGEGLEEPTFQSTDGSQVDDFRVCWNKSATGFTLDKSVVPAEWQGYRVCGPIATLKTEENPNPYAQVNQIWTFPGDPWTAPTDPQGDPGTTFLGWYTAWTNGQLWDFNTVPLTDQDLYAKFSGPVVTHTVTFYSFSHGIAPGAQTVNDGATATKPADLTDPGWTFLGWSTSFSGGTLYDFSTPVTSNVILYGQWTQASTNTVTVTLDANGHGTAPASQTIALLGTATKPSDPSAPGWTFVGWSTNPSTYAPYNFAAVVKANLTLYAWWTAQPAATHTVTFNANGHGTAPSAQTVADGAKATKPADLDLTAMGWWFDGWFTLPSGGTAFDFDAAVTSDLVAYAHWRYAYTIGFYTSVGTAPAAQTVGEGDRLVRPPDPVADGWHFDGWTMHGSASGYSFEFAFDFTYAIAYYGSLYADWSPIVTFDANGHGTAPASQVVADGAKATVPTPPTASGWTFDGWFTQASGGTLFSFDTSISQPTTLYAHWSKVAGASYDVAFNANGHGTAPATQSVDAGSAATQPSAPSASGWIFNGWSTEPSGGSLYDFSAPVGQALTLYAQWSQAGLTSYDVTFHANGHGTAPSGQTINAGEAAIEPASPHELGWTFLGWFNAASGGVQYDFATPVSEDVDLYAQWSREPLRLTVATDKSEYHPGERIVITGTSNRANEQVGLELHSNPIFLGNTSTDGAGNYRLVTTVPRAVPLGSHTVVAQITDEVTSATATASARIAVRVVTPKPGVGSMTLPDTGSDMTLLQLFAGLSSLGLGGLLMAASRRSPSRVRRR